MPTEYRLNRSGDVPVAFAGELVSQSSSERREGFGANRWHDLKLYRTAAGRLVLAVSYQSRWRDENPQDLVIDACSAADLRNFVRAYDPVPPGVGYPARESFRDKQTRLAEDLRSRFNAAVSELFAPFAELAERID